MKEKGSENVTGLQGCNLSEEEQAELHRLICILNDPTAPPGELRDERLALGAWLDAFDNDVVGETRLQHEPMVRRWAAQFSEKYGNSGWPEDRALAERCAKFLRTPAVVIGPMKT